MDEYQKKIKKLFAVTVVLSLPALVLRVLMFLFAVDPSTLLFIGNPYYGIIFNIYCGIFSAFLILYCFFGFSFYRAKKKNVKNSAQRDDFVIMYAEETRESKSKSAFSEFNKAVLASGKLSEIFSYILLSLSFLAASFIFVFDSSDDGIITAVSYIMFVCGVISAAYFVISAVAGEKKKTLFHFGFLFAPMLYFALRLVFEYRDILAHINRNVYFGEIMFIISAIALFVYQIQSLIASPQFYRPYIFAFSALFTVFYGMSVKLPEFMRAFFMPHGADYSSRAFALLDVAVTLYAFTRLVSFTSVKFRIPCYVEEKSEVGIPDNPAEEIPVNETADESDFPAEIQENGDNGEKDTNE